MRKFFAAMLLIAMAFSTSALKAQSMGPIPTDDAVRIGKLDCGLTYYIRHNDYPEHRVNFYIAQRVGSIQEEESQRGLAHFLEHMAFNGSEHFNGEGKSIIDYTRSLGVAFGKDLNAYTSIAETVYNINDVPSTRQSAIDSCLLILKDWSNGLLLTDEEIDKERGVIHEEWRLRRSAQQRMLENQLETLYPGSKFGKRMPIGLMSVVDNFKYIVPTTRLWLSWVTLMWTTSRPKSRNSSRACPPPIPTQPKLLTRSFPTPPSPSSWWTRTRSSSTAR